MCWGRMDNILFRNLIWYNYLIIEHIVKIVMFLFRFTPLKI